MARPKVTDTPEFLDAVTKAVDDKLSTLLGPLQEKMSAARAASGVSAVTPDADHSLIQELAIAIAQMADQGSGRKRVSPEELAMRESGLNKMLDYIAEARASGKKPTYRVINETYLGERRIMPYRTDPQTKELVPQLIDWSGIPNNSMLPIDDSAKKIFEQYGIWAGQVGARDFNAGKGAHAATSPMWVTLGGLVVRTGGTGQRRMVGNVGDPVAQAPEASKRDEFDPNMPGAVEILGPNDPRAKEVRVLGTIAPPAKQNAAPEFAQ